LSCRCEWAEGRGYGDGLSFKLLNLEIFAIQIV